jgi:hypothetical protein
LYGLTPSPGGVCAGRTPCCCEACTYAAAGFVVVEVVETRAHWRQSYTFSNNVCKCWTVLELAVTALNFRRGRKPRFNNSAICHFGLFLFFLICGVSAAANVKGDLTNGKSLTYRRHL